MTDVKNLTFAVMAFAACCPEAAHGSEGKDTVRQAELDKGYEYLCALRDEVIDFGVMPSIEGCSFLNPYLDEKTC